MMFQISLVARFVFLLVFIPTAVICDCPQTLPNKKTDVNLEQFHGVWYEYAASTRQFPFLFMDDKCVPLYFNRVTMPVVERIYYKNVSEADSDVKTIASYHGSDGVFKITYVRAKYFIRGSFLVLDTDYTCWAVVYACDKSEPGKLPVYVSILERSVEGKKCFTKEKKKLDEVSRVLDRVGLKLSDMNLNNAGDNCFVEEDTFDQLF